MCFYDDGDPATLSETEIRKARKPHKCGECGRQIRPGELYLFAKWLYEGDWGSDATCGRCELLRQKIHEIEIARGCGWYESWCPPGQLRDAVAEDEEYAAIGTPTTEEGQAYFASKRVVVPSLKPT